MNQGTEPAARNEMEPGAEARRQLLKRIVASEPMRRASRLQELLLFLGECSLEKGRERLQELEIGVRVFGRPETYDTRADNVVRTNVSDLRKRIEVYFQSEGRQEPIVLEIPRGNYLPVFITRHPAPDIAGEPIAAGGERAPAPGKSLHLGAIAACLVLVALAAGNVLQWVRIRDLEQRLEPWKQQPAVAAFWQKFFDDKRCTDLVLSDASLALVQDLGKQTFPLAAYISRDYLSELGDENPALKPLLERISTWDLGAPGEFEVAERVAAMDPLHRKLHLVTARKFIAAQMTQENVILLGSPSGNPWAELFQSRLNFVFLPDNPRAIANRKPARGEQATYAGQDGVGYCSVAYLANPNGGGSVLLMEGTSAEAVQAAGEFLLSEPRMEQLRQMAGTNDFPHFEVLLKTSWVNGTAYNTNIEAFRTHTAG